MHFCPLASNLDNNNNNTKIKTNLQFGRRQLEYENIHHER